MKGCLYMLLASAVFHSNALAEEAIISDYIQAEIEVLSWSPRIFVYRNFLTDSECDYLIEQSIPYLTPSTVVDDKLANGRQNDPRRNSEGMAFPKNHNDPILTEIENKISLLTLIPVEHGENIQILHYQTGGEYQPHFDYFDPKTTGGASFLANGGQRVASFLMYLNTPKEAGETIFPKVKIKVEPKKGDALLFFDCQLDGNIDPMTLHGGAPVKGGEKWLATKWLRQFPFK